MDVRFGTYFLLIERLLVLEESLLDACADPLWRQEVETWKDKTRKDTYYKVFYNVVQADGFWDGIKLIARLLKPVMQLLTYCSGDYPTSHLICPVMGKMFEFFDEAYRTGIDGPPTPTDESLIARLRSKWTLREKYWRNCNLYKAAAFFDITFFTSKTEFSHFFPMTSGSSASDIPYQKGYYDAVATMITKTFGEYDLNHEFWDSNSGSVPALGEDVTGPRRHQWKPDVETIKQAKKQLEKFVTDPGHAFLQYAERFKRDNHTSINPKPQHPVQFWEKVQEEQPPGFNFSLLANVAVRVLSQVSTNCSAERMNSMCESTMSDKRQNRMTVKHMKQAMLIRSTKVLGRSKTNEDDDDDDTVHKVFTGEIWSLGN